MAVRLLYGEETYLLESRLKKIKKEFGELIKGINFIQIDETNVKELISDIETPAFGYEKKLIIAKNTGLFNKEKKTAKGAELALINLSNKIAEYITENIELINESVEVIFVEESAEKNTLYKTIEKLVATINHRCTIVGCSQGEYEEALKLNKNSICINNRN